MPTEFGKQVLAAASKPTPPITIEEQPYGEFLSKEQALNAQGSTQLRNDDATLFGAEEQVGPLFGQRAKDTISSNYAWNKAQEDATLNGDPSSTGIRAQAYSDGLTVQDELVEFLLSQYTNEHINYGVLEGLTGLPADEQLNRITEEVNRLDAKKLTSKQNLLIHMQRQGFGDLPAAAADSVWMSLDPIELEALGEAHRASQLNELRLYIDQMAAAQGFTTGEGVAEILQQDFIPIYGAVTRVLTAKAFTPEQISTGILPGEIRQDIREWFAGASHADRVEYLQNINTELDKLRKGPHAAHFTRYAIVENLMGLFTEDLLQENLPKDSLDRWMGNLDVLLEAVYGVALLAKSGHTVNTLFRAGDVNSLRQAAKAAGNTEELARIDTVLREAAEEFGISGAEASIVDLPRPAGLRDHMEVLPDSTKKVIQDADVRRGRMLTNSDDVTGLGLTRADKDNAVRKVIEEIDSGDGLHVNHRMMNVEVMPNDVGVRITAVLGRTPEGGWDNWDDLVQDLVDLDPRLETFEIVKRGKGGNIEKVDVTADELARYVVKGEVPAIVEQGLAPSSASSRLFGGRKLSTVSQEDLFNATKTLDPAGPDFDNIVKELTRRREGIDTVDPLRALDGDEYYIRMQQDRYWHTIDKEGFNSESFLSTGIIPRPVVAPNGKFGDDIVGAFFRAQAKDLTLVRDFDAIYKPFYKLGPRDKRVVENVFEWAEDFAKSEFDRTGRARAPTYEELITEFDGLTAKQIDGYAAIREGLDIQWELFNRRLYRDFSNRGLRTARALDPNKPSYHGVPIKQGEARAGGYFDPETNEIKVLEQAEVEDIYNAGGNVIELDFPIDAPNGGKFNRVLVRAGDYELGDLSKSPLNYYEGYHMRFYDDPVYIVKHTKGGKVNGVESKEAFTEAIRTAGSTPEARQFINKYATKQVNEEGRYIDRKNPNVSYEIRSQKNINNVEGTLFQQQALYREGRLFWDKRNMERLPDVNGNRAKVQDLAMGLEKGTAMATRQVTHEDLFQTLKHAFGKEFEGIIDPVALARDDLKTIISKLRNARRESNIPEQKKRINDALELAKYLRVQMGTDSAVVPILREATISVANWISQFGVKTDIKALKKFGGWAERRGQSVDPFRAARSVAFRTFMVFRPARQLLLQSAQISYLLALDPTYIGTGRIFADSFALRRGIKKMTTANYADGWNDSHFAKAMGLSKKEYKRVVEEFHRSGLLETIDVHAFNPSANRARGVKIRDSILGRSWYRLRGAGQRVEGAFQAGFDIGERNNVTFSYMVALRRALKNKKYKSLTEFSRTEWDDIMIDASNLALAMTRPNKFGYQSGATGMVTQFLSFSHKAALGLIGQNPALKGQGLKIALSGYLLYGANMFGAEEWTREQLAKMGLVGKANKEVLPGITLSDLLAAGIIESSFNAILRGTTDAEQDFDLSFLAPGVNVAQIYESAYEALLESPTKGFLGPFSNPASGFMKGAEFIREYVQQSDAPPSEKFMKVADTLSRNVLPGYNDANRAILAYTTKKWLDKDGDSLPVRATLANVLARGLLGVRTEQELAYYRLKDADFEKQETIRNAVNSNKAYIKELLTGYAGKEYGFDFILEQIKVLNYFYDEWPEGLRREIFLKSLTEGDYENPPVMELIVKLASNGSDELSKIIPWIEAQDDMSPQERQQLTALVQEIEAGYKGADQDKFNTGFRNMQLQDRKID